jgi:magnesium-transporting ATPase (P-type)
VTEVGLLKYLLASKLDVEGHSEDKEHEGFVQFVIPFNSMRKRQTTAVKLASGKVRVFCKGGPEILMELCNRKLD